MSIVKKIQLRQLKKRKQNSPRMTGHGSEFLNFLRKYVIMWLTFSRWGGMKKILEGDITIVDQGPIDLLSEEAR